MKKEHGFVLIVALMLLAIVTILVVNSMRSTTMNEKMAGNYMDRTRAYQAAEQGVRQAQALLQNNADSCLEGCTNANVVGTGAAVDEIPSVWSDINAADVHLASGQQTSAKYLINLLPKKVLPANHSKDDCQPYSIMSKGQGIDSRSVVVLQITAFICPIA
jgi:type IV pilus assembly protein PilX